MYEIDGIAYAGEPDEIIKVKSARVINDLCLLLTFSTGEQRIYDAKPLLQYPAFQPLSNKDLFNQVTVECGTVTWDNGRIDIAPETLYQNSFEYEHAI